jgi:hypothetical protein
MPIHYFRQALFKTGGAILVFKKGEMLLNKSYGYANLELSVPMQVMVFSSLPL